MANPNLSPLCTGVLLTTKVAMSSGSCVEEHSLDMTGKKSGLQVIVLILTLHGALLINLISVRLWNFKEGGSYKARFLAKINILKGNHCILRIRGAPVCQKLA